MDLTTADAPELEDFLAKLDEQYHDDKHFLPEEVRYANLRPLSDANLEGRYQYYLRDYTFEQRPSLRREFQREMVRSLIEIRRRAAERRGDAVKVALAGPMGRFSAEDREVAQDLARAA